MALVAVFCVAVGIIEWMGWWPASMHLSGGFRGPAPY